MSDKEKFQPYSSQFNLGAYPPGQEPQTLEEYEETRARCFDPSKLKSGQWIQYVNPAAKTLSWELHHSKMAESLTSVKVFFEFARMGETIFLSKQDAERFAANPSSKFHHKKTGDPIIFLIDKNGNWERNFPECFFPLSD